MDPVRNPYAPGAGQRPPELAGRDRELSQFEVVLERIARGRPERSIVLTGLRGVGKTVLLNSFRSMALQRLWGTGKIEARPEQSIRRPVAGALHMAVRELAPRHRAPDRIEQFLGVLKAFAARDPKAPKGTFDLLPPDSAAFRKRCWSFSALSSVAESMEILPSSTFFWLRSIASRLVSSSICRLRRASTVSFPVTSRERKNCESMNTESRKMMTSNIVDRASTNPGQ